MAGAPVDEVAAAAAGDVLGAVVEVVELQALTAASATTVLARISSTRRTATFDQRLPRGAVADGMQETLSALGDCRGCGS